MIFVRVCTRVYTIQGVQKGHMELKRSFLGIKANNFQYGVNSEIHEIII